MAIDSLTIHGLRGFATAQTLHLARPRGEPGSGLTMLVGPNNGGKSTVIEALRTLSLTREPPSFTEGKRNKAAGDRILVEVTLDGGQKYALQSKASGGSETEWVPKVPAKALPVVFVLPSRRYFSPHFGRGTWGRDAYISNVGLPAQRGAALNDFSHRLFHALDNRGAFDAVLRRVLDPVPDWTIDQSDHGDYYLKIMGCGSYHNSDGIGEGLVSLFFVVDALHDSNEGDVIVIDEPELSLHPSLQKRLATLLSEYARSRQIVYATHSPYFLDFAALAAGAALARLCRETDGCHIFQLRSPLVAALQGFLSNLNNPHILGLAAREAFFLHDRIILVEGQEDVVIYGRMLAQLDLDVGGDFFGWGAGGADNFRTLVGVFRQLGFRRVVGLLDSDKSGLLAELQSGYPEYRFHCIPTHDVRSKPARVAQAAVEGLTDSEGKLNPTYEDAVRRIASEVEDYFTTSEAATAVSK